MKLLEAAAMRFFKGADGVLKVSAADGTVYQSVRCVPLFPISDPDRHVSVQTETGTEHEEVGIVPNVCDLASLQQRLVREDISFRYFVPEIIDIAEITCKRGVETWQVMTDRGDTTFSLTDKNENIVMTDKGVLFLTDLERFRYKISNQQTLPHGARALLDKVLL